MSINFQINSKLIKSKPEYKILIENFIKVGKVKKIAKGDFVLKEGDKCDYLFFILEGSFRAYRCVNDKDVTIGFSFQGDIDTCPFSFFNNLPSTDIIEALTESKIILISKVNLDLILKNNPDLIILTHAMLSNYIEILLNRIIYFKIENAEENYLHLLQQQPAEISKIPLQYIASYLGISKERLSRIRKKMKLT